MQLSQERNNDAQRYADKLTFESIFEHDKNNKGHSENIGVECNTTRGSYADVIRKFVDSC